MVTVTTTEVSFPDNVCLPVPDTFAADLTGVAATVTAFVPEGTFTVYSYTPAAKDGESVTVLPASVVTVSLLRYALGVATPDGAATALFGMFVYTGMENVRAISSYPAIPLYAW